MLKNLKVFRGVRETLVLLFLITSLSTILAQPKDNAPYSRFGLGEQVNHSLSSAGFGGLTAAYFDPLHINILNPASLGWLGTTTFEAGMYGERSSLSFQGQSTPVWSGNLSHLSLAFPMRNSLNDVLAKKERNVFWAMNIGLMPNSIVGYDIETEEVIAEGDTTINSFQGSGGTTRLVWGNGVRYKNLSVGININYLFGQLESDRVVQFPNRLGVFNDSYQDNISIRDWSLSFGAQYKLELDKKKDKDGLVRSSKNLILGIYGNPKSDFTTNSTILRIGFNNDLNPIVTDTLRNEQDVEQAGVLPSEWTMGVMYQQDGKLRVGAEYSYAGWSKYENEAKPEVLYDSRKFAVGAEYAPDPNSYNNFLKRIRYRAGFYQRSDPRLNNLDQFAFTMGLGLPVILPRGQTSFVNLGFEFGKYNTSDAINETFVKMSVGFTLNDNTWFYKRKFR